MMTIAIRLFNVLCLCLAMVSVNVYAHGNQDDIDEQWLIVDANSTVQVDHSAWQNLLDAYLQPADDQIYRFAYGKVSEADRASLQAYLDKLQAVDPRTLNQNEQMAFWINLYNARTIEEILINYPLDSIRDISYGLFSIGPWGAETMQVLDHKLSLGDVEHKLLRPVYKDPRVHYAINCASLGCPNLQPETFTGENLERLLEKGATEYINHPRGVRVTERGLVLSSIYDWFSEDFGSAKELLNHLRDYAQGQLKQQLADDSLRVVDDEYDWSLNE